LNAHLTTQGTADACKIEKGILGSVIIKIAQDKLAKYSNMKIKCNVPKGFYYCSNLKLDDKLTPMHLLGQFNFTIDYKIKIKAENRKPLVDILSCQIVGASL